MKRRSDKYKTCLGIVILFISSIHVLGMFIGAHPTTGTDLVFAMFGLLCGALLNMENDDA